MSTPIDSAVTVKQSHCMLRWDRLSTGAGFRTSGWRFLMLLAALSVCTVNIFSAPVMAQENRAAFPADFDQMVMYGDHRRGSGGQLAYALPETIAIAQSGQTLPPGTHLVLEIYNDDALVSYFVMEKGEGWVTYPPQASFGAPQSIKENRGFSHLTFGIQSRLRRGHSTSADANTRPFRSRAVCRACRVSGPNVLQIPGA